MTMGRISDVVCFGKADQNQVAFSGYKDNIEAFLHATAVGKKTSISAGHFPIPFDYIPTVPLPLPRTLFKLAKKPSPEFIVKMKEGLERFGITEVFVGKGDPSFVLDHPGYQSLMSNVRAISLPRGPVVEGVSQLESTILSLRLYQCIDLFLRTNTYSFKTETLKEWPANYLSEAASLGEARVNGYWYREGFDKDTKVAKRFEDDTPRREIDSEETEDFTPTMRGKIPLGHTVLIAKPSKKPATTSYGPPSDVPFESGILFPFFHGMLSGDTAGLRELVSRLFFRNLGEIGKDNRESFKEFRAGIGSLPTTFAGVILSHVMKGIDLALQTQTQLYLVIEEGTYHGFCLLGSLFSVFAHGSWHRPLEAEGLRTELNSIRSHKSSLVAIREVFGRCHDVNKDVILVENDELETSSDLADLLSRVSLKESEEDVVDELRVLLRSLSFSTRFRTFKPEHIAESIRMLTSTYDDPFPGEIPVFISSDWSKMGSKEYKVFASFGPRSFSFRNSVGTEISIPKKDEEDPMKRRNEADKLVYPRILVGEKPISVCISEWASLKSRGMIRMDVQERAGGARNHVFSDKSKEVIWNALKEAKTDGYLGTGKVEEARKRTADVAFGKADFDAIEW